MPIYEYECPKCGVVEVMQRITEDPLKRCPNCRKSVKRLISLNNFHLKGTGWYATDYANKGGNGCAPKSEPKEKKEDTKPSTEKTEKKESAAKKSDEKPKAAAS